MKNKIILICLITMFLIGCKNLEPESVENNNKFCIDNGYDYESYETWVSDCQRQIPMRSIEPGYVRCCKMQYDNEHWRTSDSCTIIHKLEQNGG